MGRIVLVGVILMFLGASLCQGRTWYVRDDGTGDVPTIQAAIDSAAHGDTIMLRSGTYTGTGNYNIVVPHGGRVLCSETGVPEDCIIDCEGHLGSDRWGFDLPSYAGDQTYIRGITIRNATANGAGSHGAGGAAIRSGGSLTIRDCVFESNSAPYDGGAIEFYEAALTVVLKSCSFVSNEATLSTGRGGALFITGSGALYMLIDSCTFYDNRAFAGGAIHFPYHEVDAVIRNCCFIANSATGHGGGIVVESINSAYVSNCTFFRNHAPTGSAISTLTREFGAITSVRNCILAYGTGGDAYHQSDWSPGDNSMQCTDIYGNEGGDWVGMLATRRDVDGNFRACPGFCNIDFEPYDLWLCDQSPCLPGNHPAGAACGLIGALGQGCVCEGSRTEPSSWGGIKSLYR